jgi:hypothetical protein
MLKLDQKIEKTTDLKKAGLDLIDDKIKASEIILENKLLILSHYDNRMGALDSEVAEVR